MNKFLIAVLFATGVAYGADQSYQVCGKNVQTKIVACNPEAMSKDEAAVYAGHYNDVMLNRGFAGQIKFYVRKFSDKDTDKSPALLFPKQPAQPAVTPEPDQKAANGHV